MLAQIHTTKSFIFTRYLQNLETYQPVLWSLNMCQLYPCDFNSKFSFLCTGEVWKLKLWLQKSQIKRRIYLLQNWLKYNVKWALSDKYIRGFSRYNRYVCILFLVLEFSLHFKFLEVVKMYLFLWAWIHYFLSWFILKIFDVTVKSQKAKANNTVAQVFNE
jgi:hypothetical protein